MRNGHTVNFLTFADSRLACKDIIKKQAIESGFFNNIFAFDETGFEDWYREKYADRLVLGSRGYGYWMWKSYLIRRIMDHLDEDDYLVYADGGCTINKSGRTRFEEYLQLVDDSESGVLGFQQGWRSAEWTKGDVFEYFGVGDNPEFLNHGQVAGGVVVLRKCWKSQQLVNEWYYVCHNHYDLITDDPSLTPNDPNFKENRHDQSVFSILALKYQIVEVPVEEIFTEDSWESMTAFPFWTTRYKLKKRSPLRKILNGVYTLISKIKVC